MNTAAFLVALRSRAPNIAPDTDPLAAINAMIVASPLSIEAATLRQVMRALASKTGEYHDIGILALSPRALALVAAAIDARLMGVYPESAWTEWL